MRRSILVAAISLVIAVLTGFDGQIAAGPPASAASPDATWESLGLMSARVQTITVDPDLPSTIFAGGVDPDRAAADFFRSGDAGLSWQERSLNGAPYFTYALAVDAGVRPHDLYASSSGAILRSGDGGVTWTKVSPGGFGQIAFDPTRPGLMYTVGGVNAAARSTDGGRSWQAMAVATVHLCDYASVMVAPSDPSTVYLGGGCGLFKSTDRGTTWRSLPGAPIGVESLAVSPRDAGRVYAGTEGGLDGSGLWETTDGGAEWRRLDAGPAAPVVLLDPADPARLFVAEAGSDTVRWSDDGGATWADLGGPIPAIQHDVHALALANGYLLAGGRGGIWRLALPAPHDGRYFPRTGFRVDNDTIWDYFTHRGGVATLGYPISRTFLLQGFVVQLFQRRAVQLTGDGKARLLNLLDPGLMPYTAFGGIVLPAWNPTLVADAPTGTDAPATLPFVRHVAADVYDTTAVRFGQTFALAVPPSAAFPGGVRRDLLDGIALELWGIPTSGTEPDPTTRDAYYQRWQRGAMRYDAACDCTQDVPLAGYFKAILTELDLPGNLAFEALGSPFLGQYEPGKLRWLHDPALLPETDLTAAFEPE